MIHSLSQLHHPLARTATVANRKLWRYAPPDATDPYLLHARAGAPFRQLQVPLDDPAVVASFTRYNNAPQDEHLIWYRQPLLIEPSYGFALTGPTTLLLQSMPYYEQVGLPSFAGYLWDRYGRRLPVLRERQVISLREFGDGNYYHFYSDVLGRLALLERLKVDNRIPIVISRRLHDAPYFQQALRRGPLAERRWIVHDRCFVQADEVILSKVMPHAQSTFEFMLRMVAPPPADQRASRRIFLTRSRRRGRYLVNEAQVQQVCAEFGFEVVDTDQMDLTEQICCFSAARYVIGIHGAGLVNLIFRRGAPLSLLELFPPNNIPPHYFWIAQAYGFGYDALVGNAGPAGQIFAIDPDRLRNKIRRMLDENAL